MESEILTIKSECFQIKQGQTVRLALRICDFWGTARFTRYLLLQIIYRFANGPIDGSATPISIEGRQARGHSGPCDREGSSALWYPGLPAAGRFIPGTGHSKTHFREQPKKAWIPTRSLFLSPFSLFLNHSRSAAQIISGNEIRSAGNGSYTEVESTWIQKWNREGNSPRRCARITKAKLPVFLRPIRSFVAEMKTQFKTAQVSA